MLCHTEEIRYAIVKYCVTPNTESHVSTHILSVSSSWLRAPCGTHGHMFASLDFFFLSVVGRPA
jgi:hypothetical protein